MPHDVFISYARDASRAHAEALHRALGPDVAFLDTEEIGVGDQFPEELLEALYDARVIVIFAEPTYFTRRYCLQEFQIACGPFFQVLERQGATREQKDEAIRGIVVALPSTGVDPMMERFPSGIGGRNWPKVDEINALAQMVRAEVAANPATLRERYVALGADEAERARFLAWSRLPVPQRIGTIPVARSQPAQSIGDAFVGREDELWRIHHVLANRGAGSATAAGLTGSLMAMGGMGKTRIALEYLWRYGTREWRGGLFWINAEQVETVESQLYDVLHALNSAAPPIEAVRAMPGGVADALAAMIRAMNGPRPLFIIDNVPEAKPGERLEPLKTWCPALGEVPVLVTSRRQVSLGADGNIVPITIAVLGPDASVLMLTRDVDRHQLKDGEWKEIAQWVGHLPLALELLNGLLKSREIRAAKLLEMSRTERPSEALERGIEAIGASVPVGNLRGIAEAFQESYDRLTPDQQYAARLVAWMAPEPVPEFMVEALGSAVFKPGVRSALSTRSFVSEVREGAGAYFGSMHRVLADFVLSQSTDLDKEFDLLSSCLLSLLSAVEGQGDIGSRRVQDCFPLISAVLGHRYSLLYDLSGFLDGFDFANNAGVLLASWGRAEFAGALWANLTMQCARWLGDDHPNTLTSMNNLANMLRVRGDLARAQELQEHVLEARRRISSEEHPDTLTSMNNLSNTLSDRGDFAGAQELQERVVEAMRRILGEEHRDTLVSISNLASTLGDRGDYAGAQELKERVLEASRRILGEEHPDTLGLMNNLANTLTDRGDHVGAQQLQTRALETWRRILGEEHPDRLTLMNNLANTLNHRGDHAGAQELQERVLEARRRILGEEHPDALVSMSNLANTLRERGDHAGAQEFQERALEARRRILGEEHPDTLGSMANLAVTLSGRGDHAGAQKLGEQAVNAMRRRLGVEHPWTTITAWGLLQSYLAQGNTMSGERVIHEDLLWLLERDPDSLEAQQRQIRAALEQMIEFSSPEDEPSEAGER